MRKTDLLVIVLFFLAPVFMKLQAQVGIGTENPTHTLHIKPVSPNEDPLRIEGLNQFMQGDSALLVVDPATGIVRYLPMDSIFQYVMNNIDLNNPNSQNASEVPMDPSLDLDNNSVTEDNVQQAIEALAGKLPKGTFKSIGEARAAGLVDGDSFYADPKGVFGCSGCTITLHPGMN